MPTYEYLCDVCSHVFERFQPITAAPVQECPKCKRRKVRRVITGGAGFIFKGSGFYQTDYRSKKYQDAAKKDSPAKKDSKPDSKKDSSSKSEASTGGCGPAACKQPDVCYPEKK